MTDAEIYAELCRARRGRWALSLQAAADLVELLEQTANVILKQHEKPIEWLDAEGNPIDVIRGWVQAAWAREHAGVYTMEFSGGVTLPGPDAGPSPEPVAAWHHEGCPPGDDVGYDREAVHQHVHTAILEEVDRARAQADAELEGGVVLALADWLAHRNDLKDRDHDG